METPDGYRGILYLMRGVSSSGKSHKALRLVEGDKTKVFSTDEWFDLQESGYKANWCIEKLYGAHRWNQHRTREAMRRGTSPIVVDNTNLRVKEARVYVEYSTKYQYWVEIVESDSSWWAEVSELLKDKETNRDMLKIWATKFADGFEYEGKTIKNEHGVPAEVIFNMFSRYSPYTVEDVKARIALGVE